MTLSSAVRDEWYVVGCFGEIADGATRRTTLLEAPVEITRNGDDITVRSEGRTLPVEVKFDHVWTSLGQPNKPLFDIEQVAQTNRRSVPCGCVRVRCSPLRAVENFLDIAHFPFVHTGILGSPEHPEVAHYKVEIDEEKDEVWASKIEFFQPQAAVSSSGEIITKYMYRVPIPTVAMLYKTCPARDGEWDIITLFVQPIDEECCDAWPWVFLFDDTSSDTDLIRFQQTIFLQDRSILENQVPRRLPLDPRMEIPTRADATSVAYRRWLKRKGMTYGAQTVAA